MLHDKLKLVMMEVHEIEKRGENEHHSYKYFRATDLLRVVRESFLKHGILMTTSTINIQHWSNAKGHHGVTLYLQHELIDLESGDARKLDSMGEGIDTGDKAIYKAYTGAMKYFLRTLLMIPDVDADPEKDDKDLEEETPPPRSRQAREQRDVDNGQWQISQSERQRLFSLAQAADPELSAEGAEKVVLSHIHSMGLKSTKDIATPEQYESLCDALSGQKPRRGKK